VNIEEEEIRRKHLDVLVMETKGAKMPMNSKLEFKHGTIKVAIWLNAIQTCRINSMVKTMSSVLNEIRMVNDTNVTFKTFRIKWTDKISIQAYDTADNVVNWPERANVEKALNERIIISHPPVEYTECMPGRVFKKLAEDNGWVFTPELTDEQMQEEVYLLARIIDATAPDFLKKTLVGGTYDRASLLLGQFIKGQKDYNLTFVDRVKNCGLTDDDFKRAVDAWGGIKEE
jgi:hypothetical protein